MVAKLRGPGDRRARAAFSAAVRWTSLELTTPCAVTTPFLIRADRRSVCRAADPYAVPLCGSATATVGASEPLRMASAARTPNM